MKVDKTYIHPELLKEITEMFFGPYRPEWYNQKGIVDNTDVVIAKRLGVDSGFVAFHTNKISEEHFRKVIEEINKK